MSSFNTQSKSVGLPVYQTSYFASLRYENRILQMTLLKHQDAMKVMPCYIQQVKMQPQSLDNQNFSVGS